MKPSSSKIGSGASAPSRRARRGAAGLRRVGGRRVRGPGLHLCVGREPPIARSRKKGAPRRLAAARLRRLQRHVGRPRRSALRAGHAAVSSGPAYEPVSSRRPRRRRARRRVLQWQWPQQRLLDMGVHGDASDGAFLRPRRAVRNFAHVARRRVIAALLCVLSSLWMGLAASPTLARSAGGRCAPRARRGDTGPQEVTINGVQLTLGTVSRRHPRPPRASHRRPPCRVDKWDHYRPWIGNSVGANYVWFFAFLCTTVTLSAYVCALGPPPPAARRGERRRARRRRRHRAPAAAAAPLSCLLFLYTAMITFLLLLLLGYHLRLISINQTLRARPLRRGGTRPRRPACTRRSAAAGPPTRPHARMQPLEEEAVPSWPPPPPSRAAAGRPQGIDEQLRAAAAAAELAPPDEVHRRRRFAEDAATDFLPLELALGGGGGDDDRPPRAEEGRKWSGSTATRARCCRGTRGQQQLDEVGDDRSCCPCDSERKPCRPSSDACRILSTRNPLVCPGSHALALPPGGP